MNKLLVMFTLTVILAGCSSNQRVEDLSSEQRSKAASMKVYDSPPKDSYVILGTVTGLSCNRNKYQTQAISDHEGLEGVKIQAALLDADAVINTFCQTNSDTDWRNNCWASVKCVGDAIKFK